MTTDSLTEGTTVTTVGPTSDGRSLRRERNVDAARFAALELLSEGARPSLADIAERAGIATRSVYRYFGDADSAIADAVEHRVQRAQAVFRSEPEIGRSMPFEERLAMLLLRRLRLERLMEPISSQPLMTERDGIGPSVEMLDNEVRSALASELARHDGDVQLDELLCAVFRLRSVRSMRWAFGDSDGAVVSAISRTVRSLLADAELTAR